MIILNALKAGWFRAAAIALLIALGALLTTFSCNRVQHAVKERDALRTEVPALQGQVVQLHQIAVLNDKVVTASAKTKVDIDAAEKPAMAKTEAALAANLSWADTPIPKDVLASIND